MFFSETTLVFVGEWKDARRNLDHDKLIFNGDCISCKCTWESTTEEKTNVKFQWNGQNEGQQAFKKRAVFCDALNKVVPCQANMNVLTKVTYVELQRWTSCRFLSPTSDNFSPFVWGNICESCAKPSLVQWDKVEEYMFYQHDYKYIDNELYQLAKCEIFSRYLFALGVYGVVEDALHPSQKIEDQE